MPVMLAAFDEDRNIIVWNRECELVTGFSSEDIVENPGAIQIMSSGPEQGQPVSELLAGQTADFRNRTIPILARGGGRKIIAWSSSSHSNPIPGWSVWAVGMDVTERIQAMRDLQASETQYRRIVDTAAEGIWEIDADNRTTFVNRMLAEILDYPADEIIGRDLFDFIDEQDRALAFENLERRRDGQTEQHDFRFKSGSGKYVWTSLATNPILDEQGQYAGVLAMVTDISLRRAAEAALETHSRQLEEKVADRTAELQRLVNAMAGREIRMAELKGVVRRLRDQLLQAGLKPAADDPLLGENGVN